jgi:hypothetical protein
MLKINQTLKATFANGATVDATVTKIEPSLLFEGDEDVTLDYVLHENGQTRNFTRRITNSDSPVINSASETAALEPA